MNKKIFWVFCAVLGGFFYTGCTKFERDNVLDPGADNYVKPELKKVVLLTDDFESYTTAVAPGSPWVYDNGTSGGWIQVMVGSGLGGTKGAVFCSGGAISDYAKIHQSFTLTGHFFVEFYLMKDPAASSDAKCSFRLMNAANTASVFEFGIIYYTPPGEMRFFYKDGLAVNTLTTVATPNQWYLIKIEVDTDTKKCNFWKKDPGAANFDQLVTDGNLNGSVWSYSYFDLDTVSLAAMANLRCNIDNLEIYKME